MNLHVTFAGYDLHRLARPRIYASPTLARIQAEVASYYHIPVAEMKSAVRHRSVARPRQVAMYLARKLTAHSLPSIGERFGGRDHTTVIHAMRQIEKLRREIPEIDQDVRHLMGSLA